MLVFNKNVYFSQPCTDRSKLNRIREETIANDSLRLWDVAEHRRPPSMRSLDLSVHGGGQTI